jgi:hypothetical protein
MKTIKSRAYKIDMTKNDLDNYNKNNDDFEKKFILDNKKQGIEKNSDIYSLLLNCGVVLEDEISISKLLNKKISTLNREEKLQVLTAIDDTGHSPISNLLNSGNSDILKLFKDFIQKGLIDDKVVNSKSLVKISDNDEKEHILTAIEFNQFTDISPSELLNDILLPIYEKESLQEISGVVNQLEGVFE